MNGSEVKLCPVRPHEEKKMTLKGLFDEWSERGEEEEEKRRYKSSRERLNLLQLKMFLIRTSALLTSLLLVAAGLVTTVTVERSITCRQEIPAQLIRELWKRTNQLIDRLPKEKHFSRRLLPKFCPKCPERTIGWLEMQEMINVYQRSVFSREVVQKLLPLHYNELLHRLQHTLQHCVSASKTSKWSKTIKKVERKIKKKKRDEGALLAVREFTFILRWIDELAQHHVNRSLLRSS
ncbi:uncharacterized protein LOC132956799 [Labrus mixtus]|uniref:uncharacterized protein LOC132956799 n=1 Tax=Labrus mixtus TaxID=508554 RepID=UPI0029BFDDEE|nr:uncharacterized protein LOC132956799 [Labrus mixtus]